MMDGDTCRGVCLDRTGTTGEGDAVTVRLVSWTMEVGGPFHWAADRVLEEMLDYKMTSHDTTVCKRLRDLKFLIAKLAATLGMGVETLQFKGPQSYRVSHTMPPESVDSSASFATALVWALQCDMVLHRRPAGLRAKLGMKGVIFAEACVPAATATYIVDHMHTPWSPNDAALCSYIQDHAGYCAHIRQIVSRMQGQFRSPQERLFKMCTQLLDEVGHCAACKTKWKAVVAAVVAAVDTGAQQWGDFDLMSKEWLNRGP